MLGSHADVVVEFGGVKGNRNHLGNVTDGVCLTWASGLILVQPVEEELLKQGGLTPCWNYLDLFIFKVSHEGDRLLVLKLSELSWGSAQEVIQLHHKDGSSPFLILGSFLTCGITDNAVNDARRSLAPEDGPHLLHLDKFSSLGVAVAADLEQVLLPLSQLTVTNCYPFSFCNWTKRSRSDQTNMSLTSLQPTAQLRPPRRVAASTFTVLPTE
ncbi:hypothetical protein FQN60_012604 [Etheostoma spectabile]|uniref:Uncharacterized protein n=1 Tax=Etheostoma spectabile TaxID=54343 RepID=A0A5J5D720_9PERO|nr:hypothetical protein FQN60_012604 [Etheostoma spectabile]